MKPERRSLRHSMPSLHWLVLFEASARHLNFSKAAEELAVTQSAISHGVRQLEAFFGGALFLREGRTLALTSYGQRLFSTVSKSFGSIAETVNELSDADRKHTLVVGTSTVLATEWLLPRIPTLRRDCPDLRLEVRCLDRDSDLMAAGIDVQLRLGDGNWPGYDAIRFWPEQIIAVCSPQYLRLNGPIHSVSDLRRHRLIRYADPHRLRVGWLEWLQANGADVSGKLKITMQVNDSLVSLKAAEAGEGVALGWIPIVNHALGENRLARALPDTMRTGRHHYILTADNFMRRRLIKQFSDWLIQQENT